MKCITGDVSWFTEIVGGYCQFQE